MKPWITRTCFVLSSTLAATRIAFAAAHPGPLPQPPVQPAAVQDLLRAHLAPSGRLDGYPSILGDASWIEQKLLADDGGPLDGFGATTVIDGTTAFIAAINAPASLGAQGFQGKVYVFNYADGVWTYAQTLTASDAAPGDAFGTWIAVDGTTAIISSPLAQVGSNPQQGAAYVFTFAGGTWTQAQKLTASDGNLIDTFGDSVALSGNTAIIGATGVRGSSGESYVGAAYVFTEDGGVWTEGPKLTSNDRAEDDLFGVSSALVNGMALIGANQAHWSSSGPGPGAVYVFTNTGGTWNQTQMLTASDGVDGDYFGAQVRADGDTAVIGAPGVNGVEGSYLGAAYTFVQSGGQWTQDQTLVAPLRQDSDFFGRAVAIKNGFILIGAPGRTVGSNAYAGAAELYTNVGGAWTSSATFTASDNNAVDYLGWDIALLSEGPVALAGAPHLIDDGLNLPGAAYSYVPNTDPIFADGFDGTAP